MFRRKVPVEKKEEVLPVAEDSEEDIEEEEQQEEAQEQNASESKNKGFNFSLEETGLIVAVLANSEEIRLYQKVMAGKKMAEIIAAYQAAMAKSK